MNSLRPARPAYRGLPPADRLEHDLPLGATQDAEGLPPSRGSAPAPPRWLRIAAHHPLCLHRSRDADHLVEPALRLASGLAAPGPPRASPDAGSARECRRRAPGPAPRRRRANRMTSARSACSSAARWRIRCSASGSNFGVSSLRHASRIPPGRLFPERGHQVTQFLSRHRAVGAAASRRDGRQRGSGLVVPHPGRRGRPCP